MKPSTIPPEIYAGRYLMLWEYGKAGIRKVLIHDKEPVCDVKCETGESLSLSIPYVLQLIKEGRG